MTFHLRNLQDESKVKDDATKFEFCKPLCDPFKKSLENCDELCFIVCDKCCKPNNTSLVALPIPPLAPPPPIDEITGNFSQHYKHHGLSLFLTVSLVVLATAFFVFSCYSIYKLYFLRFRRRPSDPPQGPRDEESGVDEYLDLDQGPVVDHHIWYIRTVGLDPSVITAIPIVKFSKGGGGPVESADCAVCLSEFEEDENLRLLPKCSHAFHVPCIDTWLLSHTNCPVCRAGIVSNAAVSPPLTEALVDQNLEANSDREAESEEPSELRLTIEESMDRTGLKISNVGEDNLGPYHIHSIHPMRRSISMDFLSVNSIANPSSSSSSSQSTEIKEPNAAGIVSTNSNGINRGLLRLVARSSSTESSSMKRSLSCSAKLFLHRYSNRGRNQVNLR